MRQRMLTGTQLTAADRAHVLNTFVHRFTGDHKPAWAHTLRPDGTPYMPQFADDADWLCNTKFMVKADGRIDMRAKFCESHPTWPQGEHAGVPSSARVTVRQANRR